MAGAFDQWQEAKSLLTERDGRRMEIGGQVGGGERSVKAEGQVLLKHAFFFNLTSDMLCKDKTVPLYEIIYWTTDNY